MKSYKPNYYKIVTIVGIILSLLWIIFVKTEPYSDFAYYNTVAQQVANGGQWGNTYTSVGYSIILGFIYKIFGSSLVTAKLFNVVLTTLSYIIFYKVLMKINLKESRRKIIYTLFVFFPSSIFYNSILGTEIIFTTIFLLVTLIYFSDVKYKYALIGILAAVNAMIKPFFIVFFFAIFLVELLSRVKLLKVIKHSAIILAVSLLVISPWVYRNTKLVGQFTFISNNGGIVLYINNNSQNKYGRWMDASKVEDSIVNKKEYQEANMTQKNKMLGNAAKKWIVSHPGEFIVLGFKRLFNTYLVGDDIGYAFNGTAINNTLETILIKLYSLVKNILFIPVIILIIISTVRVIISLILRESIESFTLYGLICFYMFTCTYFVTEGQGRYSFPVIFIALYFFSKLVEYIVLNLRKKVEKLVGN